MSPGRAPAQAPFARPNHPNRHATIPGVGTTLAARALYRKAFLACDNYSMYPVVSFRDQLLASQRFMHVHPTLDPAEPRIGEWFLP
jgi:hypothetical protein